MMTYETKVKINKPVDKVFKLFSDLDKTKDWMTGLESIKVTSGSSGTPGSRLELIFQENGRNVIFQEELLTIRPNESMTFKLDNKHLQMITEVYLKPIETKSEVMMTNVVKSKGFLMKLMLPFMKKMMSKRQLKDLMNLKELMEN